MFLKLGLSYMGISVEFHCNYAEHCKYHCGHIVASAGVLNACTEVHYSMPLHVRHSFTLSQSLTTPIYMHCLYKAYSAHAYTIGYYQRVGRLSMQILM